MFYIWNLRRQEFWKSVGEAEPRDETALWIKRLFGIRSFRPPELNADADCNPNDSSESDFKTATQVSNRISRRKANLPEPSDPSFYEASDPNVLERMVN